MKLATFNINGLRSRLGNFLTWLTQARPDVVCLQEIKVHAQQFPLAELKAAGYGAAWLAEGAYNGVAILTKAADPIVTRRALPGDPADKQCRYIEAAVNGCVVACLYAPNGNPQPGPRFDYKLRWLERLHQHAAALSQAQVPVIFAGDFNVVPTEQDMYRSKSSWKDDALVQPAPRAAFVRLLELATAMHCARFIRSRVSSTGPSGITNATAGVEVTVCASITCSSRLPSENACSTRASIATRAAWTVRAIMRRCGSACAGRRTRRQAWRSLRM